MKLLRSIPMWAGLLLSLGAGAAEGPPGITVQPTDSALREGELFSLRISADDPSAAMRLVHVTINGVAAGLQNTG